MLIALAVILCILLILFAALTLWLPSFVMTGKRQTLDEAMAWQSDHYDTGFYTQMDKKQYTVRGSDGYLIHAELLPNPASCGRYVILSHGYTDNRIGSLKYARMYLDLGFSCILYDLRGHGENERTFTTYGIRESEDLKCLIEDTRARYPDVAVLGLHGESLGAATTLTALWSGSAGSMPHATGASATSASRKTGGSPATPTPRSRWPAANTSPFSTTTTCSTPRRSTRSPA